MKKKLSILTVMTVMLGASIAYADVVPEMYAPWPCGEKYAPSWAYGDHPSTWHTYAYDFPYAYKNILAPADGTIRFVRDSSTCEMSESCKGLQNYVTLELDEYPGYAVDFEHLNPGSAKVKVGQHVTRGTVLGVSGKTGRCSGPHLHMQVQKMCGEYTCQTIPFKFKELNGATLQSGQMLVSQNCSSPVSTCTPSTEVCDGKDNDCNGLVDEGEVCEVTSSSEVRYQAMNYDPMSTDIDGDGKSDICIRNTTQGIYCALSSGNGFKTPALLQKNFYDANGFADISNYATIRFADINGDKKADLCVRNDRQIVCYPSQGTTFGAAVVGPDMPDSSFIYEKYYTTIRFADINGDGKDDVCARYPEGVKCAVSTGTSFNEYGAATAFSDANGWSLPQYYATLRFADVNGDGKMDICGREAAGFFCRPSDGKVFGSKQTPGITAWSDANKWDNVMYYSTIRMADINGDGRADACARTAKGIECYPSTGTGWGAKIDGPAWSDANGWNDYDNYSTIQFGDINGDGRDDICGRANANLTCYMSTGAGFANPVTITEFSDANGWNKASQFRTIRLGDVNGDGKADVCGRSASGVKCFTFNGSGFTAVAGPAWTDADGYGVARSYTTLRFGAPKPITCNLRKEICGDGIDNNCNGKIDEDCTVACKPSEEVCDGKDNDCDGLIDEDDVCKPHCKPSEEICDGIDNDCDGLIDEDDICGVITPVEDPECVPSEEVCDGIDNDCDGAIDEDLECGHGFDCDRDDPNCGKDYVDCSATPDDPACQTAPSTPTVDCSATPDDPACQTDPAIPAVDCEATPDDPACQTTPSTPGVDCSATPDDPACQTDPSDDSDSGKKDSDSCSATPLANSTTPMAWFALLAGLGFASLRRRRSTQK